jgi:transposase
MARHKPVHRGPLLLPVVLAEQVQPGTFELALDHLVDHELDLSALDARFRNDDTGASAYDPRVMLKIVLLAYSRGLITSRRIEQACRQNVVFIAVSGDSQPGYSHIAKFVRELGDQPLFTQVLITCDRQGLIGGQMFAIDGVKLPSNARKERSGTQGAALEVPEEGFPNLLLREWKNGNQVLRHSELKRALASDHGTGCTVPARRAFWRLRTSSRQASEIEGSALPSRLSSSATASAER